MSRMYCCTTRWQLSIHMHSTDVLDGCWDGHDAVPKRLAEQEHAIIVIIAVCELLLPAGRQWTRQQWQGRGLITATTPQALLVTRAVSPLPLPNPPLGVLPHHWLALAGVITQPSRHNFNFCSLVPDGWGDWWRRWKYDPLLSHNGNCPMKCNEPARSRAGVRRMMG